MPKINRIALGAGIGFGGAVTGNFVANDYWLVAIYLLAVGLGIMLISSLED